MPDFEKIINAIQSVLKLIFGDQVPLWVLRSIGYILVFAFILLGIWGFLLVVSKITKLWATELRPLFYNPEEKRRRMRRQRFADHIESEIRRLNALEAWSDYRFAELEAEVEAEGLRRSLKFWPFSRQGHRGLRRERSLSKALELSQDRLIILEGDPGAGKSVALRHVAQTMAKRAMKARSTKFVIPIYINLKELERKKDKSVDRNLIESFILQSLNRSNDRDIEEFLESEFDKGLQQGTWLFLFDSFDELPEVLSSTEADSKIRNYADAISSFLHGLNNCRGIIASRQFRGPNQFGWPRFRILPLSEQRKLELVHRVGLDSVMERELIGHLAMARQEIYLMARNPMFLGLLCEHVRSGHNFPENIHSVFETYIETRLTRDKDRLQKRFKLNPVDVRKTAEDVAFCMAADTKLGLNPTRESLKSAAVHQQISLDKRIDAILDALEYLKLARSETNIVEKSRSFTFAHRRFQEYFATCVVLKRPELVNPHRLLTDARWRETAVVTCQTQPLEVLQPLITEAEDILLNIIARTPNLIRDSTRYLERGVITDASNGDGADSEPAQFPWPSGVVHLLSLLQDGFGGRLDQLPETIREHVGCLVFTASKTGSLSDKKMALEVAGIAPNPILLWLLRQAFESKSQWLKDIAYRQTARVGKLPSDISLWIRTALVDLAIRGRLKQERYATQAHLNRLNGSSNFILTLRLLLFVPVIDFLLHFITLIAAFTLLFRIISNPIPVFLPATCCLILLYISFRMPYLFSYIPMLNITSVRLFAIPYLRLLILLGVVWIISSISQLLDQNVLYSVSTANASIKAIPIIFILITLIWAPSAWHCAMRGKLIHPLSWPIIPLSAIYFIPKEFLSRFGKAYRRMWKSFTAITVLEMAFMYFFQEYEKILGIISITVTAILILSIIITVTIWTYDFLQYYKWHKQQDISISEEIFLNTLTRYKFDSQRLKFIRRVREKAMLDPSSNMETLLTNLALSIERAKKFKANNKTDKTVWESYIHIIEQVKGQNQPKLNRWGDAVLDEINILLEQVRSNRVNI